MNREERRQFEREFTKLMKSAPDKCDLCGKVFPHNSKTFGGVSRGGVTVLAGECCQHKMQNILASGVYVSRNFDHLLPLKNRPATSSNSSGNSKLFVDTIQSHFSSIDDRAKKVALRAGVSDSAPLVSLADSPWKSDDAAWFKAHPKRSHRMRAMFEGEIDPNHPAVQKVRSIENHRIEILVRQVEVGQRIRTPFVRNLAVSIPDDEATVHAIFDMATRPGREDGPNQTELAALTKSYGTSFTGKPN